MTLTSALWLCTAPISRADKQHSSPQLIAADAIVRIFAQEGFDDSSEPRQGFLSANVPGLPGPGIVDLCQGYGLDLTHEAPTRLATMIAQHRGDAGIIHLSHGTPDQPPVFEFQPAGEDAPSSEDRS